MSIRPLSLACALVSLLVVPMGSVSLAQSTASSMAPRPGWSVMPTKHFFDELATRLEDAVKANKMGLVTVASASDGAANQGIRIPGNKVVGVYRNDFARRMLAASIAAGIEAPIRFYVTENADGTATLSYKTPTTVFAPYLSEGGEDLRALAADLDAIFHKIAEAAATK